MDHVLQAGLSCFQALLPEHSKSLDFLETVYLPSLETSLWGDLTIYQMSPQEERMYG